MYFTAAQYKKAGFKTIKEAKIFIKKYEIKYIRPKKITKKSKETLKQTKIRLSKNESNLKKSINNYLKDLRTLRIFVKKNPTHDFVKVDEQEPTENNILRTLFSSSFNKIYDNIKKFNNGEVSVVIITKDDLHNLGKKNVINFLVDIKQAMNKLLTMEIKYDDNNSKFFTLSETFKKELGDHIDDKIVLDEGFKTSWGEVMGVEAAIFLESIIITNREVKDLFKEDLFKEDDEKPKKKKKPKKINVAQTGGFFKYTTINGLSEIDLSRYQIFNTIQKENYLENCLVHSLSLSNVDETTINNIKLSCRCSQIPKKNIKDIAFKNDYNIKIKYLDSKSDNDNFNKESKRLINLGLIDEHYFLIEKTNVTYFAINNYDKVKGIKDWNKINRIRNGVIKYTNSKFMSSFDLIKSLLENYKKYGSDSEFSLIKPITLSLETLNTCFQDKFETNIDSLEYNPEVNARLINYKPRINKIDIIVGFDFETRTDLEKGHEVYLVCYRIYNKDVLVESKKLYGTNCAKNMLYYVYKYCVSNCKDGEYNVIFMAHNVSYDARFLYEHVFKINLVNRSANNICGGDFMYKPFGSKGSAMKVHLKDTYALLPFPLQQFKNIFKFEFKKEVIPYSIYNNDSIYQDYPKYSIVEACKALINDGKETKVSMFLENIKEWNLDNGDGTFKHVEYSRIYCEKDVEVMCEGYFLLKKWIKLDYDLDIDNYLTISSISTEYLKKEDCYDNCYEFSGVVRYFLQKFAVGGRTMTKHNMKHDTLKSKIEYNDLDGVSLYPSSMVRIPGFIKGIPKVIKSDQLNMEFLNSVDYYYVEIKITKIGIRRAFSTISCINNKGVRMFNNKIDTSISYFADKVTLEDMINFQNVEFEIVKGYYFNEGFNTKVTEVITKIFNKRLEYKAAGNPMQELCKLMMNSSYGKTLLKEKKEKYTFFDNENEAFKFMYRNYNYILEMVPLVGGKKYKVKSLVPIADHFNACHIGVQILSMSKRIMNEVMCLSEDMGINIIYQDTDSMHIDDSKIAMLAEEYKLRYNRELIGKKLGQFHVDFEPFSKKVNILPVAERSIILGKKVYIDLLRYDIDGEKKYKCHYRMKGVPQNVVLKKANDDYNGDLIKLYEDLYNGKEIEFDLVSCGIKFEMCSNMVVKSKNKFIRKIKF